MKNSLLLKGFMKKNRGLLIATALVFSLAIAALVGLSGAYYNLQKSLGGFIDEYNGPDLTITTDLTENNLGDALAREIKALPGVRDAYARATARTSLRIRKVSGESVYLGVQAFSFADDDFQQYYVWSENTRNPGYQIMVDENFAESNGIKAGDELYLQVGSFFKIVRAGFLISCPDSIGCIQDEYSWGINPDFGYIYIHESLLKGTELEGCKNQLLISFEDGADGKALKAEIDGLVSAALEKCEQRILSSTLYEDGLIAARIRYNVDPVGHLLTFIPIIFFFAAIVSCVMFLAQILVQYEKNTAILKALGFAVRDILALLQKAMLIICSFASVIGIIIGYIITVVVGSGFSRVFYLPEYSRSLDLSSCLLAVAVCFVSAQLCVLGFAVKIRSEHPAEMLSLQRASNNGSHSADRFFSFLKPRAKYAVASMLRNPLRQLLSVLCAAVSVTLIFSAVSLDASKSEILDFQMDGVLHYEVKASLREEPDDELISNLLEKGIATKLSKALYYSIDEGTGCNIRICALDPEGGFISVIDETGKGFCEIPEKGIIMEKHMAEDLGLSKGDSYRGIEIVGLSDQGVNRFSYMSLSQAEALEIEPVSHALLMNISDRSKYLNYMQVAENYEYSVFTAREREGVVKVLKSFSLGSGSAIVMALALGFAIMYTNAKITLHERRRELSVLRSLGRQRSDIRAILGISSAAAYLLSLAAGFVGGKYFAERVLALMALPSRSYRFCSGPKEYLICALAVLCFVAAGDILAMKEFSSRDLSESIKDKD